MQAKSASTSFSLATPDNRFVPFAVEEGGRLGVDAEAFVDAIVRAGSADPTTWCATKTYCMRAIAFTRYWADSNRERWAN